MIFKGMRITTCVLIVAVLAFALYIAGDVFSQKAVAAQDSEKNVIGVNGIGVVKMKPDIAYLRTGVETRGTDAKKAQQENARVMEEVTAKLKSFGIKEDDIKTMTYNLYPVERYDDKTKKSYIYEYRVNNMVEVMIRDIDNIGSIIDGVSAVGSNKISSIRFAVEDTEKYYNEALNLAVINAAGKAESIAKGLGVTLKGAISVQETSSGGPMIIRDESSLMKTLEAVADMAVTPISIGEMEVSAMVSVQYTF